MTFIAACMQCIYCCMHACIEIRTVSHNTVGFHTKPTVIGMHHYRFHYKTDSDRRHQCQFCFKTGSDVSTPIKRNQEHAHSRTLTSLLFLSFMYSHFSLFSLLRGQGSSILYCRYIYSRLSHCSYVYMHRRSIFI